MEVWGALSIVCMRRSPGGSRRGVNGPWCCRGAREALGIVRLLYSDARTVRLCQLGPISTRCTFWRLLSGEGKRLARLTSGPGSPRAPEATRGVFVPLCHAPCMTLSEDWVTMPCPLGGDAGCLEPWWLWESPEPLSAWGDVSWLGPLVRREVKAKGLEPFGARVNLQAPSRGGGRAWASL
jgi:hypothetical protein